MVQTLAGPTGRASARNADAPVYVGREYTSRPTLRECLDAHSVVRRLRVHSFARPHLFNKGNERRGRRSDPLGPIVGRLLASCAQGFGYSVDTSAGRVKDHGHAIVAAAPDERPILRRSLDLLQQTIVNQ